MNENGEEAKDGDDIVEVASPRAKNLVYSKV